MTLRRGVGGRVAVLAAVREGVDVLSDWVEGDVEEEAAVTAVCAWAVEDLQRILLTIFAKCIIFCKIVLAAGGGVGAFDSSVFSMVEAWLCSRWAGGCPSPGEDIVGQYLYVAPVGDNFAVVYTVL